MMSAAFLSDACHAAQSRAATARGQQIMYGALGCATACSACVSVFAGLWLCRWWRLRRANPELLSCVWRYTGLFLSLSFAACIFGATACVFRLRNIPTISQFALIYSTGGEAETSCQRYLSMSVESGRNLSSYRFASSFESVCLFLAVALGLDRINEALGSRVLTAEELSHSSSESSSSTQSKRGRAARMQQQPLLPLADQASPPAPALYPNTHKLGPRAFRLLFKSSLVLVALFFCAALVAEVTAASIQGRSAAIYENALQLCPPNGTANDEVAAALAPANSLNAPLSASILAGHAAELSAAIAVILLYIAIGILSASVIAAARRCPVLYC
jgi:hypothetical protein